MYQKQPLVELLYGPFKRNRAEELPSGDRDWGFCLKATRSNLLQDADIGKKRHWGSGGVEVATHPVQNQNSLGGPGKAPGGEERQRGEEKRGKQPARDLLDVQPEFLFQAFEVNQEKPVSKNISLNDHVKIDFR